MDNVILIVEDSEDDAKLLQRLLTRSRVANPVRIVGDGDDALTYLEGRAPYTDRARHPCPCVLLLDLKLPRTDGFQILEWLRGRSDLKSMLKIAISAINDLASIRRAYELGANSFLTKPCKPTDVENLITGFPQYWTRSTATAPPPEPRLVL